MGIAALVDGVTRELMLFAATGLLLLGIDDVAVDLVYSVRRFARRGQRDLTVADLASPGPAPRMAIVVATWCEAGVIGATLAAALGRLRYPDYLVFVAAYPNDPATVDAIAAIAERDPRVRLVINPRPGPTTKADNLNAAWRALRREEAASGRDFAALLIHDAEDVVHPDELVVCAALIGGADAVQLPVVPLIPAKALFVAGHYSDEFAEKNSVLPQYHERSESARSQMAVGSAKRTVSRAPRLKHSSRHPLKPARLQPLLISERLTETSDVSRTRTPTRDCPLGVLGQKA